ncbi:relaxase/mobilization nuclease domain-containing protein [Sphingobacterium corticis]|uniref:Relaxase/mobilization nuclease domain-containing protein n=1 Tax=Sphingobacterium corticis TaxID=1812823 RepID=A0ABW5NK08_9SPHI
MVAIIKTGSSISRILNYNEAKVDQGVANCIAAINYPCELQNLTFHMKLNRLSRCAELNTNVSRNSVHISLNFDTTDRDLTADRLNEIAQVYMQKIGFEQQPYLVYQHHDAGHPHIHIVTVKVRPDGSRIDMQNIGRNQSEDARREIEKRFDLVFADSRSKRQSKVINVSAISKVLYGQIETKAAIQKVLDAVLPHYKFTSLPELNAVLSEFNIMADRGNETSRTYRHGGLMYRIIDHNKKPIGVPIKASKFYSAATLKYLESTFSKHHNARLAYKPHLRNKIEQAFAYNPSSLSDLRALLKNSGIQLHLRQNNNQEIYGLTFVDHITKCVFNGSALGKSYSAKPLQERIQSINNSADDSVGTSFRYNKTALQDNAAPGSLDKPTTMEQQSPVDLTDAISTIMNAEYTPDYVSKSLTKKKKKKRNIKR